MYNVENAERADDIKSSTLIGDVVGDYIDLKRSGRGFMGCCPFHEDHTPSFSVSNEIGRYNCFGCGATGDVIDFVMNMEGVGFSDACDRLEAGFTPHRSVPQYSREPKDTEEQARKIWREAIPIEGTVAERYLLNRGIPLDELPSLENLRFARLSFDRSASLHPVLVAAVRNLDGEVMGIQRIYLKEDGTKLNPQNSKRTLGSISGHAVWLHEDPHPTCSLPDHIYLCEGIEDGLSLMRMRAPREERFVWVCGGAGMMKNIVLPSECRNVTIAIDNDAAGRNAGASLARRLQSEGIEVDIIAPNSRFKDFNEYLVYWQARAGIREDDTPWAWEYYHG